LLGVSSNDLSAAQGQVVAGAARELANSLGLFKQDEEGVLDKVTSFAGLDNIELESTTSVNKTTGLTQAQTSLVVGKDILPNLHVNYSVGLLDPVNTILVRLKLGEHWLLQSNVSNDGQTGGDLIYQIEK